MPHIADEKLVVAAMDDGPADGHLARCVACAVEVAAFRRIARMAADELRRQRHTGVLRRLWPLISEQTLGGTAPLLAADPEASRLEASTQWKPPR